MPFFFDDEPEAFCCSICPFQFWNLVGPPLPEEDGLHWSHKSEINRVALIFILGDPGLATLQNITIERAA